MPRLQLALPLALLVGAAIAATTGPSRTEILLATSPASMDEHPAGLLDGQPGMRMLRISIEPGAMLPWHRHTLPNAGYLLEGELRVETHDGGSLVMRPGDSVAGNREAVRRGTAGPEGATILMFYANMHGRPVTLTQT